jgi:acyl-coenzyme A thioesterase PaaI-like protein
MLASAAYTWFLTKPLLSIGSDLIEIAGSPFVCTFRCAEDPLDPGVMHAGLLMLQVL